MLYQDVQGAFGAAQGLLTEPTLDLIKRVDANYSAGVERYNTFVRTTNAANIPNVSIKSI